ncbi:GNAT family N-acetyltransferase [Clostridiaceae bacterium M8S5]|nr:GNAT family N-acetyltransferase [Clostridiaceae bacterium M8S5]
MFYIETERLLLRDWQEEDIPIFCNMNKDKEVMQYLPKVLTEEETKNFYNVIKKEFSDKGYGLYAVESKEKREFIGFVGFHIATFHIDFTPCVEIGWRIRREDWGKGYATEAAKACIDYGFEVLGFKEVYSFTYVINEPSQKVMQKIGLEYVKKFNHPNLDLNNPLSPHVLYKIER